MTVSKFDIIFGDGRGAAKHDTLLAEQPSAYARDAMQDMVQRMNTGTPEQAYQLLERHRELIPSRPLLRELLNHIFRREVVLAHAEAHATVVRPLFQVLDQGVASLTFAPDQHALTPKLPGMCAELLTSETPMELAGPRVATSIFFEILRDHAVASVLKARSMRHLAKLATEFDHDPDSIPADQYLSDGQRRELVEAVISALRDCSETRIDILRAVGTGAALEYASKMTARA